MSHLNTVQTWLADNNLDIAYISDWKNINILPALVAIRLNGH